MAITQVQTKSVDGSGTSATVAMGPVTAGHLLTAGVRAGGSVSMTASVSDNNSNGWTQIDGPPGTQDNLSTFYAANLAASPNASPTVTISSPGNSAGSLKAIVEEYSGVVVATPLLDHAIGSGSGTAESVSTAAGGSTTVGDAVVAWGTSAIGSTITTGTGYTSGSSVPKLSSEWATSAAAGNQTATFGLSASGSFNVALAVFKLAPAAGSGVAFRRTLGQFGTRAGARQMVRT